MAFDLSFSFEEAFKRLFCSVAVAQCYQICGTGRRVKTALVSKHENALTLGSGIEFRQIHFRGFNSVD